jgi:hypothetical protein
LAAGGYYMKQQSLGPFAKKSDTPPAPAPVAADPKPESTPNTASASPEEAAAAARYVARVSKNYDDLRARFGVIPSVEGPLQMAKKQLGDGKHELAMVSAKQAYAAILDVEQTGKGVPDSYTVVRGDTLWRIARDHSPVRQGPGWVAIWKANKTAVKDFDRIEVGWNLRIPQKPEAYATRFWKPRMLARAKRQGGASAKAPIEVAQVHRPLFTPETYAPWPPPLPADLERALRAAESQSLPQDIVVALAPRPDLRRAKPGRSQPTVASTPSRPTAPLRVTLGIGVRPIETVRWAMSADGLFGSGRSWSAPQYH